MTPGELERLKHLAGKHRGAIRHDVAAIIRVKTMLLFPQIGIAAIAKMTGVSPSTIKRTKAGDLHSRVKPSPLEAAEIARTLGYEMPEL
jgi:hypothetical protein